MRCSLLPKRGSTALTFRWLLLFAETGLKAAPTFYFFFPPLPFRLFFFLFFRTLAALYHLLESCPSIPICEPYITGRTCCSTWVFIHSRGGELMDEFQMCFPRVWEDVSISGLEGGCWCCWWWWGGGITLHTAPLGIKSPRCPLLQFPSDYLTSNWLRYSDSLLAVSNIFFFFFFFAWSAADARALYIIYTANRTDRKEAAAADNHFPITLRNCKTAFLNPGAEE